MLPPPSTPSSSNWRPCRPRAEATLNEAQQRVEVAARCGGRLQPNAPRPLRAPCRQVGHLPGFQRRGEQPASPLEGAWSVRTVTSLATDHRACQAVPLAALDHGPQRKRRCRPAHRRARSVWLAFVVAPLAVRPDIGHSRSSVSPVIWHCQPEGCCFRFLDVHVFVDRIRHQGVIPAHQEFSVAPARCSTRRSFTSSA